MEQREALLKDLIESKQKRIEWYQSKIQDLKLWMEREKKSLKRFEKELEDLLTNNPTE